MSAGRILVVLAAFTIFGGWAGYTIKSDKVEAAAGKQAQVDLKKSAQNVVVSVAESARIETEVAKVDSNVTSIKSAIVKRGVTLHAKQESHVTALPDHDVRDGSQLQYGNAAATAGAAPATCPGPSDLVLDVGTVGLLDAARQGRGVDSAGGSDEEKSAPSTVGVTDLITNDLDVVQMYLELAKRHDELVDAVEKHLKDKAR